MKHCSVCQGVWKEAHSYCPRDGTALVSVTPGHDPLIGMVLEGRYQLVSCLGTGGTGFVYVAEHLGLGRDVAVKMLFADRAHDPVNVKRLLREAQMLAALDHPGIVKVLDYGAREDGSPFLVMEKARGKPLDLVLAAEGQLDPSHALHIAWQLADALAAAHALQIVHRDLKPANVQLGAVNNQLQARILDFGFAFLREAKQDGLEPNEAADVRLTRQGVIFGTPEYMSPEQIRGGLADARSDLYALGIVLYELLSGQPPFRGSVPVQVFYRHLEQPPPYLPLPAHVRGRVAEDLRALVDALLAKSPSDRPRNAASVAEELLSMLPRIEARPLPSALASMPPLEGADSPMPTFPVVHASRLMANSEEQTRPRAASSAGF